MPSTSPLKLEKLGPAFIPTLIPWAFEIAVDARMAYKNNDEFFHNPEVWLPDKCKTKPN